MPQSSLAQHSLVLYKNRAALVNRTGAKLELELEDGRRVHVRPKDVQLLHPGPVHSLIKLRPPAGEVETAWELLAGTVTNLAELAELIYGEYTPASAWATWQHVTEGLYFRGAPEALEVRTKEVVAQEKASRAAKAAEERAWAEFLKQAQAGQTSLEHNRYLTEVEELALNQRQQSRVMRELGLAETPEAAHTLLLKLGYWSYANNPYPQRLGQVTTLPSGPLGPLPPEQRIDLTHLPAFAIDDEGNQDPDDALSLEPGRLWVHVADAAALAPPDSPADLEARARGASLYLPEGTVPMLPPGAVQELGLGLKEISPALSFGLDLNGALEVTKIQIVPSWVRAQRLTYEQVETRLAEEPFSSLYHLAQAAQARRSGHGAIHIDLPEVKIRVAAGQVNIRLLPPLKSRDLVTEAMLLCGLALAGFAQQQELPVPFITQAPPKEDGAGEGLAGMFARRKSMSPSQRRGEPAPHAGLGLPYYTQATSPLRRYSDLVVHQQLRAYLRGESGLSSREILERIAAAEAGSSGMRQAERLSNKHWTLVYLLQHPHWEGEGVVVERYNQRGLILVPELDLETWQYLPETATLNSRLRLKLGEVNLPALDVYFHIT